MAHRIDLLMRYSFIFIFLLITFRNTAQTAPDKIPYYPGEKMDYILHMGIFSLGKATIAFDTDSVNCGSFIRVDARSTGLGKLIKNIQYDFGSCMDQETGLPYIATRTVVEGEKHNESEVFYYHDLRPDSSVVYSKVFDSLVVRKNIFDILSAFYFFRTNYATKYMNHLDQVTLTTFFINEVWDLTIRYDGTETIKTIFGDMDCLRFMPVTEIGPYFRDTDDMVFWVTNDKNRIPIKIYVDLKVGSITADLKYYVSPRL